MCEPRLPAAGTVLGFVLCLAVAGTLCLDSETAAGQRAPDNAVQTTAGWAETVWFPDYGLAVDAKMDTGADSSSLHAPGYVILDRGGRRWVRLSLTGTNGRTREIEAPLVRTARIRRAGAAVAERPVIALKICVAGQTGEAEFTLTDRTGMDFQMLIGRRFMTDRLLIDPGKRFAGTGKCETAGRPR
jgi:hypothetical protein